MENSTITLRDYFAGLAMQSIFQKGRESELKNMKLLFETIPLFAYRMADAMLEEKNREARDEN